MEEYRVSGMSCAACVAHVEKAVQKVPGVDEVNVSLLTNSMTVGGTAGQDEICAAVRAAGYDASPKEAAGSGQTHTNQQDDLKDRETPKLLARLFFSIVLLCPLMYLSMGHMMWGWPLPAFLDGNHVGMGICQMLFAVAVMVVNQRFFISGTMSVLHGAPNMDTLVAMGSGVSFGYSVYSLLCMSLAQTRGDMDAVMVYMDQFYFESAAMILTLITVGKVLEAYSKGRTTDALKGLMRLAPQTATVLRDGKEAVVPVEKVLVGDRYLVRPGESIPVDGVVVDGEAAVDMSAMTGESIPVDVAAGDEVIGGTINTSGFLTCEATRIGQDTTLSQIIKMVSDAAATKAPIAKTADKVAAVFVPAVLVVACVTAVVWLALGASVDFALTHAIAVLVISCPCALGLATPVAIMVGSGVGARNGILYKTAAALEMAGNAKIVVLDKTGTVTEGRPHVTDVLPNETVSVQSLLAAAGMLEAKSEHPLARAVMEHIEENHETYPEAEHFQALSGNGVRAQYEGSTYYAGKQSFIYETLMGTDGEEDFVNFVRTWKPERYEKTGKTVLFFAQDEKLLGALLVADTMRDESVKAIRSLKTLGLSVVMLTGDNERTATSIGKDAGVEAVIAGVMPQGKEQVVRRLQKGAGNVLMVGDGINDAPALTAADTGFAIGAGTDIAMDAADVVLTQSRLTDVPRALVLSRGVKRNIKENLFWAFFYNVVGIPLAAGVWYPLFGISLSPMFGAAAMSLSSFCVVMNALRLNFIRLDNVRHYRRKKEKIRFRRIISGESQGKTENEAQQNGNAALNGGKDAGGQKNGGDKNRNIEKETQTMDTKNMKIEGMMCEHCQARVKEALEKVDGVRSAEVSHEAGTAVVSFDGAVTDEALTAAVTDAGYEVKNIA
ncbi:MAG: heavy metal translocating P-type ATPase [Lachnospiraceae bacterium]|nr:heavy metal translocating P-type ATPase [Lachnospiraceae bacterium]